jgi:hypothetical protein
MVHYRCTKDLLSKLPHEECPPKSDNVLGDWYVTRLNVGRDRFLLCVAEKSLLAVVVEAKGLPTFPERVAPALANLLRVLEIPESAIEQERFAMRNFRFLPTNSRSVLGSMNDFRFHLDFHWRQCGNLIECQYRIAEMPCSPIGWANPGEATRKLFGLSGQWPRRTSS